MNPEQSSDNEEVKMIDLRPYKDREPERSYKVGDSKIVMADGVWRWEHYCTWISQNERKFVGPTLHPNHIIQIDYMGAISIHPSLICPDCGKHGFVTNGSWRDV